MFYKHAEEQLFPSYSSINKISKRGPSSIHKKKKKCPAVKIKVAVDVASAVKLLCCMITLKRKKKKKGNRGTI